MFEAFKALVIIGLILGLLVFVSWIITIAWEGSITPIFGIRPISLSEAFFLWILADLLVKSTHGLKK